MLDLSRQEWEQDFILENILRVKGGKCLLELSHELPIMEETRQTALRIMELKREVAYNTCYRTSGGGNINIFGVMFEPNMTIVLDKNFSGYSRILTLFIYHPFSCPSMLIGRAPY